MLQGIHFFFKFELVCLDLELNTFSCLIVGSTDDSMNWFMLLNMDPHL